MPLALGYSKLVDGKNRPSLDMDRYENPYMYFRTTYRFDGGMRRGRMNAVLRLHKNYRLRSSLSLSSSTTDTPSFRALASFEPGFSPATT